MKKGYIVLIVIAIIITLSVSGLVIAYYAVTRNAELDTTLLDGGISSKVSVLDAEGNYIGSNGEYVEFGEISPRVIEAFVAVEDERFYSHKGIDFKRILGAGVKNIASMSAKEGASTITQQLIKNTHLTNEKSLSRKLKEMKLAGQLEKKMTKDEIIEKYLNVIYFGKGFYGIDAAAKNIFNKTPSELDIAESAMLAGIVKSPNNYNPLNNPDKASERMKTVLKSMLKNGYIDKEEAKTANNYKYKPYYGYNWNNYSDSYRNAALTEAGSILNKSVKEINSSSYVIHTYMDDSLQKNCYSRLNGVMGNVKNADGIVGVMDNYSGAITATAGLNPFLTSRQCGSIIKPFSVYLPSMEVNQVSAATQILDEPINVNGYKPENYGGGYHGYVSVRESIAHSYNIPAVKLLNDIGINSVLPYLEKLGIRVDDKNKNLSLALGSVSITPVTAMGCYASIANGGYYVNPTTIKYISDKNGKIIYRDNRTPVKVFNSDNAFIMTDMLRSAVKDGTASKLKYLGIDIAAKTGTVGNDKGNSDAYCAAYTSRNTFFSWLGANDGLMDKSVTGGAYPTMIIRGVIDNINGYNGGIFMKPADVLEIPIDTDLLAKEHLIKYSPNGQKEYFTKLNAPVTPKNDIHKGKSIWDRIIEFF